MKAAMEWETWAKGHGPRVLRPDCKVVNCQTGSSMHERIELGWGPNWLSVAVWLCGCVPSRSISVSYGTSTQSCSILTDRSWTKSNTNTHTYEARRIELSETTFDVVHRRQQHCAVRDGTCLHWLSQLILNYISHKRKPFPRPLTWS